MKRAYMGRTGANPHDRSTPRGSEQGKSTLTDSLFLPATSARPVALATTMVPWDMAEAVELALKSCSSTCCRR